VRRGDFLELRLSTRVAGIEIGMESLGKFSISSADRRQRGIARQAERLVGVFDGVRIGDGAALRAGRSRPEAGWRRAVAKT
jgi:hypothetical protein